MTTLLEAAQEMDFAVCELPPTLQELIRVTGLTAAMELSVRYGGTELSVPDNFEPPLSQKARELVDVIGSESARRLIQHYANEKLYIPKGDKALRCARNRLIEKEYDAGSITTARLALKYRLSERQVRAILNKTPQPSKQLSFDFG
ncbi:MAG: hypothetical protein H7838_07385 [Magnetococcus sp. DMHC-8]